MQYYPRTMARAWTTSSHSNAFAESSASRISWVCGMCNVLATTYTVTMAFECNPLSFVVAAETHSTSWLFGMHSWLDDMSQNGRVLDYKSSLQLIEDLGFFTRQETKAFPAISQGALPAATLRLLIIVEPTCNVAVRARRLTGSPILPASKSVVSPATCCVAQ